MMNGDISIALLQKSLDAVWYRQSVTLNNIANSETPGYKSKSVEFESMLKSAITSGAGSKGKLVSEISDLEPRLTENKGTSAKEDGNNVNLEAENVSLAKQQLQYMYTTAALSAHINRIKYVITEGKG
ncbi:MAG: flagellar basal body rod protein FlgB [Clostridiaceae bacterium]|nr:flagellar basal body rod protein FlgB [Clostridiaceae bacterium]